MCIRDSATAMDELDAGASYAAFVIPEDFTERLLSCLLYTSRCV